MRIARIQEQVGGSWPSNTSKQNSCGSCALCPSAWVVQLWSCTFAYGVMTSVLL